MGGSSEVVLKVTCLVLACMVVVTEAQTLRCETVSGKLAPCITYLTGTGPATAACCGGVKSLNSIANTSPKRQQACRCLQSAAKAIPNLNPSAAASLPHTCGVPISYKISTSTNCNTVK